MAKLRIKRGSLVRLAGQTALEFIKWLRGEPSLAQIPIVVMSGAASGSDIDRISQVGAMGFIAKTGDVAALANSLKPFLP